MNRQEYEAEKSLNLNASPEGTEYATVLGNLLLAERYIASLEAKIELMYDTHMTANHEFGLVWQYANVIQNLKADNAKLREDNASLIEQMNACGSENAKLEKALDLACYIAANGCPEIYEDCKYPDESLSKANEVGCAQCWKEYFMQKAGE